MQQYFKIDSSGNIIGTDFFFEEEDVPNNFILGWTDEEVFFEPKWSPKEKKWVEGKKNNEILTTYRLSKLDELNKACQNHILGGFDCELGSILYHFSYDREAQLNFQETFQMFQNDMIESITWTVSLGGGRDRKILDKESFNKVYIQSLQHKQNAISRYRDVLQPILDKMQTVEQIDTVKWDTVVNSPDVPPVKLRDDNTVPIKFDKVGKEISNTKVELDMNTMALLEITMGLMPKGG